jgi:hypothetical protein
VTTVTNSHKDLTWLIKKKSNSWSLSWVAGNHGPLVYSWQCYTQEGEVQGDAYLFRDDVPEVSQNVDDHWLAAPVYNSAYQSLLVQQQLTTHGTVVLSQLSYLPSQAMCNFYLYPCVKNWLSSTISWMHKVTCGFQDYIACHGWFPYSCINADRSVYLLENGTLKATALEGFLVEWGYGTYHGTEVTTYRRRMAGWLDVWKTFIQTKK